jgi:hypothetical protein
MTRTNRTEVVFFGFFSHFFCILSIGTKCVNYNQILFAYLVPVQKKFLGPRELNFLYNLLI